MLGSKSQVIAQLFHNHAAFPFRDATPKNYIVRGVNDVDMDRYNIDEIIARIVAIDFSTMNVLTVKSDDFISILYHYMIPESVRARLLNKFLGNSCEEDVIVGAFVRLGRFWARRLYYAKASAGVIPKALPL